MTLRVISGSNTPKRFGPRTIFGGSGGSIIISSLRQVATRSYVPNIASGTNAYINTRTVHIATNDITSLQVKFPAWYCPATTDLNVTAALIYTASIEYPVGTFTQVKWSGLASVAVPTTQDDTGLSDACAVVIPLGTIFWVRNFCVANGGVPLALGLPVTQATTSTRWATQGEASALSATAISDLTMTGSVTDGGSGALIYPLCIVATTPAPAFGLIGDSRSIGTISGGGSPDANGCQGQITPSLGSSIAWIDVGVGSSLLSQFNTGGQKRAALMKYCSHVVNGYGINDIRTASGNRTSAQLEGDFFILSKMFPTKTLLGCTLSPSVPTSLDGYTTTSGQTVDVNAGALTTFNAWMQGIPSPYKAVLDIASITNDSTTPTKWKIDAGPLATTTDGLHCNTLGYTDLKASGIINPATLSALTPVPQFGILDSSLAPITLWSNYANVATTPTTGTGIGCGGSVATFTGSVAPTYGAVSFNGGPGYSFNGTTQGFIGDVNMKPIPKGVAGLTLAFLMQLTSLPVASRVVFGVTVNGSNNERAFVDIDSGGNLTGAQRRLDADAVSTTTATISNPVGVGGYCLGVGVFDPVNNTVTISCNGVVVATGTFLSTGNFSATNANNITVGILAGAGPVMVARETVLFTAALNTAQRQKVEGDIAWRNGLQATVLSSSHPYFNTPPVS